MCRSVKFLRYFPQNIFSRKIYSKIDIKIGKKEPMTYCNTLWLIWESLHHMLFLIQNFQKFIFVFCFSLPRFTLILYRSTLPQLETNSTKFLLKCVCVFYCLVQLDLVSVANIDMKMVIWIPSVDFQKVVVKRVSSAIDALYATNK